MNARLAAIVKRRTALIAQAEAQRQEIVRVTHPWCTSLSLVDRGMALFQRLRAHPLAIPLGAILIFWLGRSRKSLWAGRLWTLWQLYSSFQSQNKKAR